MNDSPSKKIDERIAELGDWRGERLAQVRGLIKEADPEVEETWKWRGVPVYVASGQAGDAEMAARIAAHVATRGDAWRTVEAPYDLLAALEAEAAADRVLLVDCLTLWLSNLMLRGDDIEAVTSGLAAGIARLKGPIVFVTNEVGAGIVPENALARRFRDAQGRLNQAMAAACSRVVLVVAGLALTLKPGSF